MRSQHDAQLGVRIGRRRGATGAVAARRRSCRRSPSRPGAAPTGVPTQSRSIVCGLPGCGAPLHPRREAATGIGAPSTAGRERAPSREPPPRARRAARRDAWTAVALEARERLTRAVSRASSSSRRRDGSSESSPRRPRCRAAPKVAPRSRTARPGRTRLRWSGEPVARCARRKRAAVAAHSAHRSDISAGVAPAKAGAKATCLTSRTKTLGSRLREDDDPCGSSLRGT